MGGATPIRRLWRFGSRAGVRLALVQALVVIAAFTLAGVLTQVAMDRLETAAVRERLLGEVHSLDEEFAQRGAAHLPHTVAKRTRLWRGFGYRLSDRAGARLAGDLRAPVVEGWSPQPGRAGAADVAGRPYLVYAQRLGDGSQLSVGQDLSAQRLQSEALTRMLILCGSCGVVFCVAVSSAFSARAWRQVAAMAAVAREVRDGRLEVRVPAGRRGPRDDLDDLGVAFNAMLDRIELLVQQVRQVSTDIAHDLRTPLTRVHQRLERLRESAARPTFSCDLDLIEQDIAEILRTFDALLQLASLDANEHARCDTRFDLADVALRVCDAYRPDVEESGRMLTLDCARVAVLGDERLIVQLISNLIENALRHTPDGTRIAVAVTTDGRPRLTVADNGPGIPAKSRAEVLRPLVRLDRSRHLPGAGVGLSVVAAIAQRHGASLSLGDADPGLAVSVAFPGAGADPRQVRYIYPDSAHSAKSERRLSASA